VLWVAAVLGHLWLDDRSGIQPVNDLDVPFILSGFDPEQAQKKTIWNWLT